jgi:hypothetical protein
MALRLQVQLHILGIRQLDRQEDPVGPLRPLGDRMATAKQINPNNTQLKTILNISQPLRTSLRVIPNISQSQHISASKNI